MNLKEAVRKLRINSLFLFIFPTIAIVGSLLIHNHLIDINYKFQEKHTNLKDVPGYKFETSCVESNGYCVETNSELQVISNKLDKCFIHKVKRQYSDNINGEHPWGYQPLELFVNKASATGKSVDWQLNKELINSNIKIKVKLIVLNEIDNQCIRNNPITHFLYKYFPPYSYLVNEKVKGITLGTNEKVNPFLYGEVSISNLVKRHPINIFFKFFLYLGVILMIAYWYSYNKIFKEILNTKRNTFYFLGLSSAVFLFFHVYFLGTTSNNEILKDFRRIIIVLFILFEVFAQAFLAFKIYSNKDIFDKYCFRLIVISKIFFVSAVLIFTISIMTILSIYKLPSSIDYILEWNYFVVLLIFYLLSSLMWKKIN
jgi:hypothetical protein